MNQRCVVSCRGSIVSTIVFAALTTQPSLASAATSQVYLRFLASPTTFVTGADDATKDQASLAPGAPVAPFPWARVAGVESREDAINRIASKVGELFAPFDVDIHLTRPEDGTYTMAVIGGDASSLNLPTNLEGLAVIDCNDANPNNVAFVFVNAGDLSIDDIAIAIAHELGHTYGLEHSSLMTDIMYAVQTQARTAFQDENASTTAPDDCNLVAQDTYASLVQVLGAHDPGSPISTEQLPEPAAVAGCAVVGATTTVGWGWSLGVAMLGLAWRKRVTRNGDPWGAWRRR